MRNGCWTLSLPVDIQSDTLKPEELGEEVFAMFWLGFCFLSSVLHIWNNLCLMFSTAFVSCNELFCGSRDDSNLARSYLAHISLQLLLFSRSKDSDHIAALIIEPGKMIFFLNLLPQ